MIINGTSLQGIFQFKVGLQYEVGDIIIYLNLLYVVTAPYNGLELPNLSKSCKLYTEVHSLESVNDTDTTKLINAGNFKFLINSLFQGLGLNGEIDTLNFNKINPDLYTSTGAHLLVVETNDGTLPPSILPGTKLLFKIYKTSTSTVQELVDYSTPILYYRIRNGEWSEWRILTNGDDSAVSEFNEALDNLQTVTSDIASKAQALEDHSRITYREAELKSGSILPAASPIVIIDEGSLLSVGLTYEISGVPYQEFLTIDTSLGTTTMALSSNGYQVTSEVGNTTEGRTEVQLNVNYGPLNAKIFKVLESAKL